LSLGSTPLDRIDGGGNFCSCITRFGTQADLTAHSQEQPALHEWCCNECYALNAAFGSKLFYV
jgi:hypothetical protein